jgi:NAD(P)-dependent dehydrogenase (short-subunit alcohol dehydrogenase family)
MRPDLAGKNCVITGGTSGIGKAVASTLVSMGANVVLVGRNERTGHATARALKRKAPGSTIEFIRADLSRQGDVRDLAGAIGRRLVCVDVLINNAGARTYQYHENAEGIETTFAANHLGHFLLTGLLIDKLSRAESARVVTVTSGLHANANVDDDIWYLGRNNYDGSAAYAKSKLANLMFAYELARRLAYTPITSNAMNPGVVATNFERNNGLRTWLGFLVGHGLKRRLVSARTAAETIVFLTASAAVAGVTGKYFFRNREVESSSASYDIEAGRRLWDLSVRLTGLTGTSI